MRKTTTGVLALAIGACAMAGSADAYDEIVEARGWTQIDYVETEYCRAEIRGNGVTYRIAGEGYRPGEEVRFRLVNDAVMKVNDRIKPVEYRFAADSEGRWRQFYVPFIPNREGGLVTVELDSDSCSLGLAFEWQRRRL